MEARERHVINAAVTSTQSSVPEKRFGSLDAFLMSAKIWVSTGRYTRQVRPIVEERTSTIVLGRLAEDDFAQPIESLGSGMLSDFPSATRELARKRLEALETFVHEVAATVAARLLDEITIRTTRVQRLRDDQFDKRQLLQQSRSESVVPSSDESESLKHPFHIERALDVVYSAFGRLRVALALAVAQVACVFSLESLLVFLSFTPVLAGTAGVMPWMIAAQALVLTVALFFFGHLVWSSSSDIRLLASGVLLAITTALAMIRAGVINYAGSGADGVVSQDPTAWAIIGVMAFSGLGLALIGGQASHRATLILAKASKLRKDAGEDIAEMEAELSTWKSAQAHHRNRERELKRLAHHLERDITSLETRLQSETAEIRQLVQQRIQETVRHSLSSEITSMARQLARWCHDPESVKRGSTTNGRLTAILGLTLLAGTACSPQDHTYVEHFLIDTSGSIAADVAERMRMRVFEAAGHWIETARPGDNFNVWWLTPERSPYPANRKTLTMPPLRVPAYASRQAFAEEAMSRLEDWMDELPYGVQRTRLLEALYFIGVTQDRRWALTILSDLRQDSPSWDSVRVGKADDMGLVRAMLELCPTVRIPPVTVSLVSWPGLVSGNRDPIKEHESARRLFRQFFEHWAPEAEVHVTSI